MTTLITNEIPPLQLREITLTSRLVVGTGKYPDYETMQAALDASGCSAVTVAVRRERLIDDEGRSILDFIDCDKYTILPNTAGCFTAKDAVRIARLGRDLLEQLGNAGSDWVKLEVLGDKTTLLPDPVGTLEACRELVSDGFSVMCYSNDDPIMATRIRDAGATCVMPAGSPIGSGRGIANPSAIKLCIDLLKKSEHGGDFSYPVIVDAGVGTPSDVTIAMELGADGVLLNTGIAHAQDPIQMARGMRLACDAGYLGFHSGRIPRKLHATASSTWTGTIAGE